jgi:hypothetical protein
VNLKVWYNLFFVYFFLRPNYILHTCRYLGAGLYCQECQAKLDEGDETICSAILSIQKDQKALTNQGEIPAYEPNAANSDSQDQDHDKDEDEVPAYVPNATNSDSQDQDHGKDEHEVPAYVPNAANRDSQDQDHGKDEDEVPGSQVHPADYSIFNYDSQSDLTADEIDEQLSEAYGKGFGCTFYTLIQGLDPRSRSNDIYVQLKSLTNVNKIFAPVGKVFTSNDGN